MLIKAKTIKGYKLHSKDNEEMGKVKEFYFDDYYWTIRYLVVETGNWLIGRKVLIPPHALGNTNNEENYITVNMTKNQIENSPPLESDKPVSRQFEEKYHIYFGWPKYWKGPEMWGTYPYMGYIGYDAAKLPKADADLNKKRGDSHLRSTHDVRGHDIVATDGEIGHVDDFIINDQTWQIRYLEIDTKNWWPGKKVLISPRSISDISWLDSEVKVDLSLETIKKAPAYDDDTVLSDNYEAEVRNYYNQKK